jgi:hypothetical protein
LVWVQPVRNAFSALIQGLLQVDFQGHVGLGLFDAAVILFDDLCAGNLIMSSFFGENG